LVYSHTHMDFMTGCERIECVWMPVVAVTVFWVWVIWEYGKTR